MVEEILNVEPDAAGEVNRSQNGPRRGIGLNKVISLPDKTETTARSVSNVHVFPAENCSRRRGLTPFNRQPD